MDVALGEDVIWLGKYRLIATLGRGGMADVNLAMISGPAGSRFSKLAVVKQPRIAMADDPEFVTMLVDEARITANLRHPNVVQTLEVGLHEGKPFLAMEYLDGLSVRHLLRRAEQQNLSIPREVQYVIVADILAGLHHAHELTGFDGTHLAIVHRDMTPHNVFVTVDGQVKILDFGIAKAINSASITQQGIVKGKLRYMSPEQARGMTVDRRADIFSVGVVLWEAATGRRFWDHQTEADSIGRALIAGRYRVSPREIDSTVPEALDAICVKALALDPADRYPTAEAFRVDLENFLGDDIIQARRKLGPLVTTLSEAMRARLRTVIEEAAAYVEPPPSFRDTDALKGVAVSLAHPEGDEGVDDQPVEATVLMPETRAIRPELWPAEERGAPAKASPSRRAEALTVSLVSLASLALLALVVVVSTRLGSSGLPARERTIVTSTPRGLETQSAALMQTAAVVTQPSAVASAEVPPKTVADHRRAPPRRPPPSSTKSRPAASDAVPAKGRSELSLDTRDPWSESKGSTPR